VAIAGEAVKWLRDNLGIINKSSEIGMFFLEKKKLNVATIT
jgi:glycerol kinase